MKLLKISLIYMLIASTLAGPQGLRLGVDDEHQGRVEGQGVRDTPIRMKRQAKEMRIIGGKDVPAGIYTFFAQFTRGCGGSLIASDMLLTVAHVSCLISHCLYLFATRRPPVSH
jgi:hypothetical protein